MKNWRGRSAADGVRVKATEGVILSRCNQGGRALQKATAGVILSGVIKRSASGKWLGTGQVTDHPDLGSWTGRWKMPWRKGIWTRTQTATWRGGGQVQAGWLGHQHDVQEMRVSFNLKNMEAESYRAVTYHHHSNKMNMMMKTSLGMLWSQKQVAGNKTWRSTH